ncbi:BPSS1780 family membrane protein [Caenimonas terrae]|uniref:BPSS1780 family membrane protein n=1 Tax=Caenimonas terrae TaxID=696074 RepID=A0ABW0NHC7_9BURK
MKLNIVPARTGLTWVRLGITTFFRQPLALAGLFSLYAGAMWLLAHIPLVGAAVSSVLVPAATLGMMAASQQAASGKFPMPTVLLSAFRVGRARASAMLVLGVLYGAGWFAAITIAGMVTPPPAAAEATTAAGQAQLGMFYLVMSLLTLPLSMLFWHAPALVHWHGVAPVKSLFFSIVACLRNFGAMLVFGLAWSAVLLAMVAATTLVAVALGGPPMVENVFYPLLTLMTAMFLTSIYFSFRDSFVTDEAPPPGEST